MKRRPWIGTCRKFALVCVWHIQMTPTHFQWCSQQKHLLGLSLRSLVIAQQYGKRFLRSFCESVIAIRLTKNLLPFEDDEQKEKNLEGWGEKIEKLWGNWNWMFGRLPNGHGDDDFWSQTSCCEWRTFFCSLKSRKGEVLNVF